jgi:hypothetical protein
MKAKILELILKKLPISKLLPTLFRLIAEGRVDAILGLTAEKGLRCYPLKRLYWATSGIKTYLGMALYGVGAGLETIAGMWPEAGAWAGPAAHWCYVIATFGVSVGLVDGATRAPYPAGTKIPAEAKTPAAW